MRPSGPNTTGPGSPSHIDLWLEDVTSAHTAEHEKSQRIARAIHMRRDMEQVRSIRCTALAMLEDGASPNALPSTGAVAESAISCKAGSRPSSHPASSTQTTP